MSDRSLQNIKAVLKSLVISQQGGLTIKQLNRDYQDLETCPIPFVQLGYSKLETFLRSINDTLIVESSYNMEPRVYAVHSEASEHIGKMVAGQKRQKKGHVGGLSRSETKRGNQNNTRSSNHSGQHGTSNSYSQSNNRFGHTTSNQNNGISPNPTTSNQNNRNNGIFLNPTSSNQNNRNNEIFPNPASSNQNNRNNGIFLNPTTNQNRNNGIFPNPTTFNQNNGIFSNPTSAQIPSLFSPQISQNLAVFQQNNTFGQTNNSRYTSNQAQQYKSSNNQIQSTNGNNYSESTNRYNKERQNSNEFQSKVQSRISNRAFDEKTTSKNNSVNSNQNKIKTTQTENGWDHQQNGKMTNTYEMNDTSGKLQVKPIHSTTQQKTLNSWQESSNNPAKSTVSTDQLLSSALSKMKLTEPLKKSTPPSELFKNALPDLREDDPLFSVEIPKECVQFGTQIEGAQLSAEIKDDSLFTIYVTEIHSPNRFWFHIEKDSHIVTSLMRDIENHYSFLEDDAFQFHDSHVVPGQVCAVLYCDLWHRAEIVSGIQKDNTAKVHFMDYGTTSNVPLKNIKYLLQAFTLIRAQAYRGSLAYIQPKTHIWSREATHSFLEMTRNVMLFAKVTNINREERIVHMIVIDTNTEKDVNINEKLVDNGLATVWLVDASGAQLKRHNAEQHPTFAMLELGTYPSFYEIGNLLTKGIDFEAMQDETLAPEWDIRNSGRIMEKKLELNESNLTKDEDVICATNNNLEIGIKLSQLDESLVDYNLTKDMKNQPKTPIKPLVNYGSDSFLENNDNNNCQSKSLTNNKPKLPTKKCPTNLKLPRPLHTVAKSSTSVNKTSDNGKPQEKKILHNKQLNEHYSVSNSKELLKPKAALSLAEQKYFQQENYQNSLHLLSVLREREKLALLQHYLLYQKYFSNVSQSFPMQHTFNQANNIQPHILPSSYLSNIRNRLVPGFRNIYLNLRNNL